MWLIGAVIGAIVCALIASSKGRNVALWALIGFLLGCIGIIIVAVMPNVKEEQARQAQLDEENRRLREQLRQERIKAEVFREHTQSRLDAHDNKLGMDTRQTAGSLGTGGSAGTPELAPVLSLTKWYYQAAGATVGPIFEDEMRAKVRSGELGRETLVWAEHLQGWQPVHKVSEFSNDVGRA